MKGNQKRILSVLLATVVAVTTVWYVPPQFEASASGKTNMEKALELLASPSEASKREATATPSEAESLGRESTPSEAEIPDGKASPSQAVKKFVRVEPEEIPQYYSQVSASGKKFWKFEDRNGMMQYRDYGYMQGDAEFPLWYVTDLTGAVDDTSDSVNLDEEYYNLAPYIWKSEEPDEKNWSDLEQQYQILITGKENLQFENWDSSIYEIWHLVVAEIQTNHQNENLPDDDYSEEDAENNESYSYNEETYQQEIIDLYFFYGHEKNSRENSNSRWLVSDSNGYVSFPSFVSMLAAKDEFQTLNLYFYNNVPGETKTSSASYVKRDVGKFRKSYVQGDSTTKDYYPEINIYDWGLAENAQKVEFPYLYKEGYKFLGYLPEYASQYIPGSIVNFADKMQLNPQKYDYLVGYNPNFKEPTTSGNLSIINVAPSQFGYPLGACTTTGISRAIKDSTGFVVIPPGSEIEARMLIGGINRKYCTDRPSYISFYGIWLKEDLSRLTLIDDVSKLYSDWGTTGEREIKTDGNYYRSISLKEKGTKVDISYLLNSNPFRGFFYYYINKLGALAPPTGMVHTHDLVFGGYWSEPNGKGKQLSKIYTYDKDDDKYYAYWIPVGSKFNVRYQDENGNQIGSEQIIEASRKSTPPEAPLKEGYNFIGWKSIDGNNSTPDVISRNVTFGPEYEQKNIRYKVTFRNWDGTIINEQNIPYGGSALEPKDPRREGYVFNGWSQSLDNIRWDTEIDAQYLKLYKLTLDAGDGKIFDNQTYSIQIKEGTSLQDLGIDLNVLISSTVKSGSKCSNYYNGTEYLSSSFKINGDESFKAVYTKNITNIKFYPMLPGGSAGTYNAFNVNQMEPLNYNYYSSYTSQKYKGYTFLGWCENSLGKGRIINNGDIVPEDISTILYGIWNADDIVYNVDYGPINDTTSFPKRLVLPSWVDDKTLATQYLPKYNDLPQLINGYALPSSNTTTWTNTNLNYNFGEGITTAKLSTDSEVFLKWNANPKRFYYFAMYPNSNNVGYKMVSGKSGSGKTYYGQMMAPDDIAKLNDVTLIPPGTIFHGWFEGNSTTPLQPIDLTKPLTPKDSGSKSASDLYFYIYMVCANQSSKITFRDWDGTILSEKMVNYGDSIEIPKTNRNGYDFIGWDVDVNENTKFASDTTITAQYEEPGFKINLFANGGKFVEVNESGQTVQLDNKTFKIDDVSNLEDALSQSNLFLGENAKNLNRAGYTFDWFDDPTAGNSVSQINESDILKHKKNLYARWVNAYTVTFKDWDARVIDEQVVRKNKDAKLPEEPKREGYTFVGWSQSHQNITVNTTLTAKYEALMSIKFRRYNLNQAETLEEFYDEKIVHAGIWPVSNTDNDAKLLWGLSANSEKVKFPILESEGDIFLGWTRAVNQGGPSSSMLSSEKNYNGYISQIYNNFYARTEVIAASKYDSPYAIGNVTPGFPLIPAGTEVDARAFMSPKADSYMSYNGVWIPKDKPSLILINGFKDCFGGFGFRFIDETNFLNYSTVVAKNVEMIESISVASNFGSKFNDLKLRDKVLSDIDIPLSLTNKYKGNDDSSPELFYAIRKFLGYFSEPNGRGTKLDSNYVFNKVGDKFYAYYVPKAQKFKVIYQDENGYIITASQIDAGKAVTNIPKAPVKPGYDFVEWETFIGGNSNSNQILRDTTFRPKYQKEKAQTYILTLAGNDGTFNGTDLMMEYQVEQGHSLDEYLHDAELHMFNPGNVFVGWFTDDVNGTKVNYSDSMPSNNLTIYAQWNPLTFNVVYKNWNGEVLKTQEVAIGADATPPSDPVREGYAFNGWDKPSTNIQDHTTITAQYKANLFALTLDGNGGTIAGDETKSQMISFGESMDQVLEDGVANASRKYYTFGGWYTMPTGGSKYTGSGNTMPASSVTVYAHWVRNSSEIVYKDWNGDVLKTQEVAIGADATPPSDPVREGYAFNGWDKPSTNIQDHTTITAQYKANLFALTLDGNGGTIAGDETKSQMISFGESMDQVLEDGVANASRKYYTFGGWYTMPTGGSKYTGSGNTMPAFSVSVYAHWVRKSSEVVYKDWDGNVLKTQEVAIGADATPPEDPVRPGYTFIGWDKPSTNIQSNTTITAVYTADDYKQTTEEKNNVEPVLVPPAIDTTTKSTVPDSGGKFIVNPENPYDVTYTKPDGTPAKDEWIGDGKDWYHADEKGKINYDWYLEGEKTWYKLNQENGDRFGAALIGWYHEPMDDKRYFFDLTTTKMLTGWQNINGKSYYFTTNNEGQTYFGSNLHGGSGWKYDPNRPGKPYGSMYRNEYTPDGYWVDENGVCADKK